MTFINLPRVDWHRKAALDFITKRPIGSVCAQLHSGFSGSFRTMFNPQIHFAHLRLWYCNVLHRFFLLASAALYNPESVEHKPVRPSTGKTAAEHTMCLCLKMMCLCLKDVLSEEICKYGRYCEKMWPAKTLCKFGRHPLMLYAFNLVIMVIICWLKPQMHTIGVPWEQMPQKACNLKGATAQRQENCNQKGNIFHGTLRDSNSRHKKTIHC